MRTRSGRTLQERAITGLLLIIIAILVIAIYNGYSPDIFNEFEYAMNKTLGNFDAAVAGR